MSDEQEPSPEVLATAESIRDVVTAFILEKGWALEQLPRKLIWKTEVDGKVSRYRCYLQIDPDLGQFVFYGVLPFTVEPERWTDAAVALAAINYGLAVGKFELDLRDGELRFSTGIDVHGTTLDPIVLRTLLQSALDLLDAYSPSLRAQVSGPTN